jgi:DUF917 family protein
LSVSSAVTISGGIIIYFQNEILLLVPSSGKIAAVTPSLVTYWPFSGEKIS